MNEKPPLPPVAEMQAAYLQRDAAYDGLFLLGVRTTGIFCRPTCPARKPRPENVEYFATAGEALAAGYRPCLRCRPTEEDEEPVWARRLMAEIDQEPSRRITDGDLAVRGVDPATVRRYFKRRYGMTFQAYLRSRRLSGAFHRIRNGGPLDSAVFESGYDSHSGFREAFARTFGTTPGGSRSRDCLLLSWLKSPLGPLIAGATAQGICLLEFVDRRMLEMQLAVVRKLFPVPAVPGTNRHLEQLEAELSGYFAGALKTFSVPLVFPGTEFQQRVWKELLGIPYGETRSYEDLAVDLGIPSGPRAVGRANGQNRICIVIPCHRVVQKNGSLGGYGGGLRRKEFLLALERGGR